MNVQLASWACTPERSRGRRVAEASAAPRSEHQRDRDRIVHGTSFRRLVYKTQVFLNHEGDHFRTRLTHSLEVAQLSRSMARRLRLNEDLVEAIALAHDLGHTPFGHAGQDAVAACMQAHGGFEHNLQSLRVVDHLEQRYAAFDGLNLTFETREGILKHCSRRHAAELERVEPDGVAARFLRGGQASLEAQLVDLADEMAYNAHDIDDGLRSGLISVEQVLAVPLFARFYEDARMRFPGLSAQPRRWLAEALRAMLAAQVEDLVASTQEALLDAAPADVDAVRALSRPLVRHGAAMRRAIDELKRFLFHALYRHAQVQSSTDKARQVVTELFEAYRADPGALPDRHANPTDTHERVVADYVAGMTDRFALREHHRLTGRQIFDTTLVDAPVPGSGSRA
jgi:dGTPase